MPGKPKAKAHREPPSRFARVIDNIIRHKLKWIFAALLTLGPAGVLAIYIFIEPAMPALHYWVRELVTEDHTYIIYLKLRDARQSLKDAKASLAKSPDDPTPQRAIDYYESVIKKYQTYLDAAAAK